MEGRGVRPRSGERISHFRSPLYADNDVKLCLLPNSMCVCTLRYSNQLPTSHVTLAQPYISLLHTLSVASGAVSSSCVCVCVLGDKFHTKLQLTLQFDG